MNRRQYTFSLLKAFQSHLCCLSNLTFHLVHPSPDDVIITKATVFGNRNMWFFLQSTHFCGHDPKSFLDKEVTICGALYDKSIKLLWPLKVIHQANYLCELLCPTLICSSWEVGIISLEIFLQSSSTKISSKCKQVTSNFKINCWWILSLGTDPR